VSWNIGETYLQIRAHSALNGASYAYPILRDTFVCEMNAVAVHETRMVKLSAVSAEVDSDKAELGHCLQQVICFVNLSVVGLHRRLHSPRDLMRSIQYFQDHDSFDVSEFFSQ